MNLVSIRYKNRNMEKMNRLPESWCVKNDGSQLFKDTVIKYLRSLFNPVYKLRGIYDSCYYGVDNGTLIEVLCVFGNELTIGGFIELSGIDYYKDGNGDGFEESIAKNRNCEVKTIDGNRAINISLEMAKGLWKICNMHLGDENSNEWIKRLFENFTKAELEGKEGFSWEDSVSEGFYIHQNQGKIFESGTMNRKGEPEKVIFKTEKQALSALAFAQLTHIVTKYNEGKQPESRFSQSWGEMLYYTYEVKRFHHAAQFTIIEHELTKDKSLHSYHLGFCYKKDAEISLRVNAELWNQYWILSAE